MSHGRFLDGSWRTPLDLAWPYEAREYANLAQNWGGDAVEKMLASVWRGYDELVTDFFGQIDITQADDELERTITQILEFRIRQHLSGDEPYYVQHGSYEFTTRRQSPAQPPQYDIAFVLIQNPKIMWPLEAKVLRSDRRVGRYVRDIQQQFLTGRYAPYVNGAAMLGYLIRGCPVTVFDNISQHLACRLLSLPIFSPDRHRVSVHLRTLGETDFVSGTFRCHHLIMKMYP